MLMVFCVLLAIVCVIIVAINILIMLDDNDFSLMRWMLIIGAILTFFLFL